MREARSQIGLHCYLETFLHCGEKATFLCTVEKSQIQAECSKWLGQLTLQTPDLQVGQKGKKGKYKTEVQKIQLETTDSIDCLFGWKQQRLVYTHMAHELSICLIVCLLCAQWGSGHVYGGLIRSRPSGSER